MNNIAYIINVSTIYFISITHTHTYIYIYIYILFYRPNGGFPGAGFTAKSNDMSCGNLQVQTIQDNLVRARGISKLHIGKLNRPFQLLRCMTTMYRYCGQLIQTLLNTRKRTSGFDCLRKQNAHSSFMSSISKQ
jgi:hypothetical protein